MFIKWFNFRYRYTGKVSFIEYFQPALGAGWSTNGAPYSDDFYKKLAEMFGDYSYTIYLFEDTEDTEQRLFIEVTKDNINVSVAD